jgi:hypothetical protein
MSSAGSAISNSNARTNVNKRALILRRELMNDPGPAFASERRIYDALDNREAVTYAGVRARNERHQVSIDARKPVHRLGNIIPSLGPTMLLPSKYTV